jgi:hypothetical protein
MRKLLFIMLLATLSGMASCQTFYKGNVFTLHVIKVRLKSGITVEQFTAFMTGEFLPAWEEHYEGVETILVRAIRGTNESEFGWINYYESEAKLKEYYPEPGVQSDKAKAADQKMKPLEKELVKYGTMRYAGYTTWLVQ